MISKDLLSDVTGDDVKDIYKLGSNPNVCKKTLIYSVWRSGDAKTINIHELTCIIKEWLYKRGVVTKTVYYGEDNVTVGWAGTDEYYTDQSEFEGCVKLATRVQRDNFKQ